MAVKKPDLKFERPTAGGNADAGKYGDGDAQYDELTGASKFAAPARGFAGTEGAGPANRNQPVQFEAQQPEADPFGLDQFLSDVKKGAGAANSQK